MKRTSGFFYLVMLLTAWFMQVPIHAQIVDAQNACTWGISNNALPIPSDSIIRDAKLTLHDVRTVGNDSQAAVYVQLLDNPVQDIEEIMDAQTGNFFDGYGTFLQKITAAELSSTPRDITISLNQLNNPEAWVWSRFDAPVIAAFGDASTQQLSSSLLALLDYTGTGSSFGFGLDCDSVAIEGVSLELKIQSMADAAPAATVTFQAGATDTTTPNRAPVLVPIADKIIRVLQPLMFSVASTDLDNDRVAYSVANLPEGAVFTGQTFIWTPTTAQAGTYTVTFTADDGNGGMDSTTVQITVKAISLPGEWTTLVFDDFESGWGSYTDGGSDSLLYTRAKYAPQGNNAVDIQSSSDSSLFTLTDPIDVKSPGYSEIQISFSFMAVSMDSSTDGFSLEYWDGTQWVNLNTWHTYTDFSNWTVYSETVELSKSNLTFPDDMKIRFVCQAADAIDDVMIDEIRIAAR